MRDTRIGRQKRKTANLLNEENIISKALKRGQDLAVHISDNLKKKVFKEKDLKVIEHSRYLLGASELVERINVPGGCGGDVMISNLTWNRFEDSSVAVDSRSFIIENCTAPIRLWFRLKSSYSR